MRLLLLGRYLRQVYYFLRRHSVIVFPLVLRRGDGNLAQRMSTPIIAMTRSRRESVHSAMFELVSLTGPNLWIPSRDLLCLHARHREERLSRRHPGIQVRTYTSDRQGHSFPYPLRTSPTPRVVDMCLLYLRHPLLAKDRR